MKRPKKNKQKTPLKKDLFQGFKITEEDIGEDLIKEFAIFFANNPNFVADENLLGDNLDDINNEEWKWF